MSSNGNQPDSTKPKSVSIILIIGILFVPFIFSWFTLRKGHTTKAKAIAFGWFFVALLILGGNKDKNANSSTGSGEVAQATPQVEFIKDGCREVSNKFSAESKLSEIQQKEAWKAFEGKIFKWNLVVQEVSESGGGYNVDYKCTNSDSIIKDVEVQYAASDKDLVLRLVKGKNYQVTGKLVEYSVLALTAEKF